MLEFFLSRVFRNRYKQVESWMRDPVRYQHDVLMEIIYKGCFTEFGAKHGFETVKDYDSFVRQVPVRDHPEFSPYIDRMRKREEKCPLAGNCGYVFQVIGYDQW